MIKRIFYSGIILGILFLGYLSYLSTKVVFDERYAHLLMADGEIIDAQVSSDEQWRILCEGDLPDKLATTLKLFEDQYFDYHVGVNPVSIIKAVRDNARAGHTVRGGSTITMQLARIAEGNKSRTYRQKIREIFLAFALELTMTKSEILTAYAQHAPYGGNTIGYCAASLRYYDKSPEQLTWTEAATLSVLPNAPGKIYPGRSQEILVRKRNFLLDKLLANALIDSVTHRLSILEDLPQQSNQFASLSPHLLQRMKQDQPGVYNHQTTLDASLQSNAVRILSQYQEDYKESTDVNNMAAIILRQDGSIAAYVANVNCGNDCGGDVDLLRSQRSPGSTLKPLLYGMAIDQGLITPQSLVEDIPIFYNGYSPANFDKKYRGVVAAEEALTTSLNIPAVNLLHTYGTHPFLSDLRRMGFTTMKNNADHYGLSLILGGSEVMPLELATTYCNLTRTARGQMPITAYHNSDRSLEQKSNDQNNSFPMSVGSSYLTLQMLKGVNRPSSEDGWQYFESKEEIAWKTGTSFGLRDAWSVGCSKDYTVLVWVGNADGEGKAGLTGIGKAAPLLFDLFKLLPNGTPDQVPTGSLQHRHVCAESGYSPSEACQRTTQILMPRSTDNLPICSYHQMLTLDISEEYQVYQECVSEVKHKSVFSLEPIIDSYYRKSNGTSHAPPPYLPGCAEATDVVSILYPKPNAEILLPTDLDNRKEALISKALTSSTVDSLYWFVDDELITITQDRHELSLDLEPGKHRLTVVSNDGAEQSRDFEVLEGED